MTDLIATLAAEDPARDATPTAADAARMDEALRRLVAAENAVGAAGEAREGVAGESRWRRGGAAEGGARRGVAGESRWRRGGVAGESRRRRGGVAGVRRVRPRRRAWALVPVALATVALSLGVALPGGKTPAVIAPTPANAATVLADLRGKVVAAKAPGGRFAYQKQVAYVSHMRGATGGGARFVVVLPHDVEQWVDADGTAIVREVVHEDHATFPTPEDKAAYEKFGQGAPPWRSEPYRVDDYELAGLTVQQITRLPTEPGALKAKLEAGKLDLLPAAAQLLASPVPSAELKGALLTVLKGLPGAKLLPTETDPRGRTGVGVQFEDDAWRTLFLFDPDTGALLGTRSIGKKEVPGRTISDWWLVIAATRTDTAPTTAR